MNQAPAPSSDTDIRAAQPPAIVRTAGGSVLGTGALVLLVVLQTFTGFSLDSRTTTVLVVLGLLGGATVVAGLRLMRARAGSAVAGLMASGVLFLATTSWLLFSFLGGLFSVFALLAPVVALLGIALSAASLGPCQKVAAARARLAEQGLDLGL